MENSGTRHHCSALV